MNTLLQKNDKKTIGEVSIDTRKLYDYLISIKMGDEISYAELSKLIGRNVQGTARNCLLRARIMAQRDCKIVFGAIFGKGLKRLADNEIVEQNSVEPIRKIRRITERTFKKSACVDTKQLTNDQLLLHNATLSGLGAIALCSGKNAIKTITHHANDTIPSGKVLELFMNK